MRESCAASSQLPESKMSEATVSDEQLRLFIERIERLEEEKKGIADDIRDTYNESKSQGYDPQIMRQLVRLRKLPVRDRKEMDAILDELGPASSRERVRHDGETTEGA